MSKTTVSRRSPLDYIVCTGYVDYLDLFIKAGADVNMTDTMGNTLLHRAAECGHWECLRLILNAGADVNATDEDGTTALMLAISVGGGYPLCPTISRIKWAQLLLKSGAHVNKRNKASQNALDTYLASHNEINKDLAMLLFAAGEKSGGPSISGDCRIRASHVRIPSYLLEERKIKLPLKEMARMVIRKHLMRLDLYENLFHKIPRLGLPSLVVEYLLYDMSLDIECNSSGTDL